MLRVDYQVAKNFNSERAEKNVQNRMQEEILPSETSFWLT